ncbi:unnamed protein product [Notodromas monacha]|uniref:CUB domain-containing protein n=1 Tax=Notodromas monacha TaxID=399045 RepID=A0A7R9BDU9_9CRUS|nr:unnamed protein product [Notodromas monacha]CAG0913500.1 unnamed protein product [Notodromas monacha]
MGLVCERDDLQLQQPGTLLSKPARQARPNLIFKCLHYFIKFFFLVEICEILYYPVFGSSEEPNEIINLHSICKEDWLGQSEMITTGIVLWSDSDPNMNCKVTFQTGTALQHFMIRFDHLRLDCNDKLMIFDSDHSDSEPKLHLSCKNIPSTVGSVQIPSNYLTVVFVTDREGLDDFGFRMVITAFKKPGTFDCRISAGNLEELVGKNGLIAIAVGVGGLLLICCSVVVIKCSRRHPRSTDSQSQLQMHQMSYPSGTGFNQQVAGMMSYEGNGNRQARETAEDMYLIGMTSVPRMGNAALPVDGMGFKGYTDLHLGM